MPRPRNIRKNDTVLVIAGKDRGRQGRVLRLAAKTDAAVVEGIGKIKRHTRPNPQKQIKGGILEKESPVHISNLKLVCPECGKPARTGHKTLEDGRKVRVCRRCAGEIDS